MPGGIFTNLQRHWDPDRAERLWEVSAALVERARSAS